MSVRRRSGGCLECANDLEHCHGVAIEHADGVPDCTEGSSCRLVAALHAAAVPCTEMSCDCALVLITDDDLPARRRDVI